jgi:hypothetical protein
MISGGFPEENRTISWSAYFSSGIGMGLNSTLGCVFTKAAVTSLKKSSYPGCPHCQEGKSSTILSAAAAGTAATAPAKRMAPTIARVACRRFMTLPPWR